VVAGDMVFCGKYLEAYLFPMMGSISHPSQVTSTCCIVKKGGSF